MTEFAPKVSVIIPVYNGSNYLAEAIESALKQDYKNIEIVVVNDGSSDGGATAAVAAGYGNKIRYFEKPNGGVASALNFGVRQMTGDFFSWLSHDDLYLPNKIAHQIDQLRQLSPEKRESTLVYSDYTLIDGKGKQVSEVKLSSSHKLEKLNFALYPLVNGLIHGCTLLIPKKAFSEVALFDETLKHTQDYALWLLFFRKYGVAYCPEPLVCSRVHEAQDSKRSDAKTLRDLEVNALWRNIFDSISRDEMILLWGSVDAYFRNALRIATAVKVPEVFNHLLDSWMAVSEDVLVSVIIPFFNRTQFTAEAIESALNQTYKNIEVIVVDDGSTENVDAVKAVVESDQRARYFRQENSGPGAARNLGIHHAAGDYVCFLDSDDRFLPSKIQKQLSFMQLSNSSFSHTSYVRIDEHGQKYAFVNSGERTYKFPSIYGGCAIATPTVMVRTSVIRKFPFEEKVRLGEDVITWANISKSTNLDGISLPLSEVRILSTTSAFNPATLREGHKNISNAARKAHFRYWFYMSYLKEFSLTPRGLIFLLGAPIYRALPVQVKEWFGRAKLTRFCHSCGERRTLCTCHQARA